jgi:hypothetical protein
MTYQTKTGVPSPVAGGAQQHVIAPSKTGRRSAVVGGAIPVPLVAWKGIDNGLGTMGGKHSMALRVQGLRKRFVWWHGLGSGLGVVAWFADVDGSVRVRGAMDDGQGGGERS